MSIFLGITEFVAVAETQGFSTAGRHLGIATSQTSRRVSELEGRLGVALVARTTRKVRLTDAGHSYYEYCKKIIEQIDTANEVVTEGKARLSGTLRISAGGDFAENHVIPALMDFVSEHPDLELDIDFNSKVIDFIDDGYDFAIRFGSLPDSNLIARKLSDHLYAAVASPDYLNKFGRPTSPRDLARHKCITTTYNRWTFQDKGEDINISVKGQLRANNVKTLVNACKKGLGVLYLPKSIFSEELKNKQLEPILTHYWKNRGSTWIVYSERKFLPLKSRLAIEYLVSKFSNTQEHL